jgi:hypothetical protein
MLQSTVGGVLLGALTPTDFLQQCNPSGTTTTATTRAGGGDECPPWDDYQPPIAQLQKSKDPLRSKRMPVTLLDIGGLWPLEDSIEFGTCDVCKRRIRLDAFCEHIRKCDDTGAAVEAAEIAADAAKAKTRKKPKRELNLNTMCSVICIDRGGAPCMRSLSCKTHPVKMKRLVEGRTRPFDDLLQEHEIAMGRGPHGSSGAAPRARTSSGGSGASHKAASRTPTFVVPRDIGPLERAKRKRTDELARGFAMTPAVATAGGGWDTVQIPMSPATATAESGGGGAGGASSVGKKRKARRRKLNVARGLSWDGPQPAATCGFGGSVRTASGAVCWSSSDLLFHSVLQRFEASVDLAALLADTGGPDSDYHHPSGPPPALVMARRDRGHGQRGVESVFLPPLGALTATVPVPGETESGAACNSEISENQAAQLFHAMVGAEDALYGTAAEFTLSGGAFDPPVLDAHRAASLVAATAAVPTDYRGQVAAGSLHIASAGLTVAPNGGTAVARATAAAAPTGNVPMAQPASKRPRRASRSAAIKPPTPINASIAMPPSSPTVGGHGAVGNAAALPINGLNHLSYSRSHLPS